MKRKKKKRWLLVVGVSVTRRQVKVNHVLRQNKTKDEKNKNKKRRDKQ